MSKGLRHFDKKDVLAVAHKRSAYTAEQKKAGAPRGLGWWGAHDFLKKKGMAVSA
jgi:hypothetical protein